jgi:hypothetical protein
MHNGMLYQVALLEKFLQGIKVIKYNKARSYEVT